MTEQNSGELNQQDVFKYIDQELKSGKSNQSSGLFQKTQSSFKLVLLVNLLAIIIASSGFLIVNKIFKDQAYKLVGSEKSIKGLEDVLLSELQKKANAELINKQKELDSIKQRLTDLNGEMDSFRATQEKKLKKKLALREKELKQKMLLAIKNKSSIEQAEIQKKYKAELKKLNNQIMEESIKKEEEYKKKIAEQKKSLLASQKLNEKDLQQAKSELASTQDEYKKKLEQEKQKSQNALRQVSLKLDQRQKIDDFYFQINTLFQQAIKNYQVEKYDAARVVLNGVKRLYATKSDEIVISPIKKDVDMFFVTAINDYLSIKENTSLNNALQEYAISLKNLEEFSDDLKRGVYNSKVDQANKKINQLKNQLPQVFEFYSSYSGYEVFLDDLSAQKEINVADSQYAKREYESAANHYLNVLKKYPRVSARKTLLNRLSTALLAGGEGLSPDIALQSDQKEIDKKAKKIYDQAKIYLSDNELTKANNTFQNQILQYPLASYTKRSIENINLINKKLIQLNTVDLDKIGAGQDKLANPLFQQANIELQNKDLNKSAMLYEEIILNYPLSRFHALSMEQYKSIQEQLHRTVTDDLKVNEKEALQIFNDAISLSIGNQLNESLVKYQELIINYPGSTNNSVALRNMDEIYRSMGKSTNVDIQDIAKKQNKQAIELFKQANDLLVKNEEEKAVEKYAEVLIKYPLSSLVEESIQGLEQAWERIAAKKQNILNKNDKKALVILQKAQEFEKKKDIDNAILNYYNLILTYPNSSYTTNALDYILNLSSTIITNTGVDLDLLKEEQSKGARSLFLAAQESENNKQYQSAIDTYSTIIKKYPLSFYITESIKGLQRSISAIVESKINTTESSTQTAIFLTQNIGRVVDKIGDEIIVDIFNGNSIDINDDVYIMRKQNDKILFYVGEAKISRISPVMSKALVVKEVGIINIGDLIFMK